MEVGNGVVEARRWEGGELLLELPEGECSLPGLLRRCDRVVAAGALDEAVHAPPVPLPVAMEGCAVMGGNERERSADGVRLAGYLRGDVGGDALDVAHQRCRVFENVVVDALQNHGLLRTGLLEDDTIGVVDVAAAVGLGED